MTVPHAPARPVAGAWVVGHTSWFWHVLPHELTRLRLTSQPLLVVPSQFFVPVAQGTQPLLATQVWASPVQVVTSPQVPSPLQIWEAFVLATQRFWPAMHSAT